MEILDGFQNMEAGKDWQFAEIQIEYTANWQLL